MATQSISCLCFSKDRPLQCEGYIQSLKASASIPVKLTIVYACKNEQFQKAYELLGDLYSDVDFVAEKNLRRHVIRWLNDCSSPYVMFGCDDVVFKKCFNVETIDDAFQTNANLQGFSLRLGNDIYYSAMHLCTAPRPQFIQTNPYLLWDWRTPSATHDWAFPFELNCTVYRKEFILELTDALNTQDIVHPHWGSIREKGWNHPNLLEGYGVTALRLYSRHNLFASFPEAKAAVITVNRVQDVSENFVYDDGDEFSDDAMLEYWNDGYVLDIASYKGKSYPAIHIGDLHLCKRQSREEKHPSTEENFYDFHKVVITDFAKRIVSTQHGLSKHPAFPEYIKEFDTYFHLENAETDQRIKLFPCLNDKQEEHHVDKAYFYQDSWAFSRVNILKPKQIVDIGSTVLLVGIYSYVAPTISVELRPLPISLPGLTCKTGSITNLPFEDKSIECLSSMCVIEHIGLGRYGDPLDPQGSSKAFHELERVIAPNGHLIISIPISPEPFIAFNANRSFKKEDVLSIFKNFEVCNELFLYPDPGPEEKLKELPDFESAVWCVDLKRIG